MPRTRKAVRQLEAHDAAGYETEFEDFSAYDDGYGNQVAHGDLSMQRLVEHGWNEPWPENTETPAQVEGYDKDPFQSELHSDVRRMRDPQGVGVPRAEMAETLSRRYKSPTHQRQALTNLERRYGGTHAPNLQKRRK